MKIVFFQLTIQPEKRFDGDKNLTELRITVRTDYNKVGYIQILHEDDTASHLERIMDEAKRRVLIEFDKKKVNTTKTGAEFEIVPPIGVEDNGN